MKVPMGFTHNVKTMGIFLNGKEINPYATQSQCSCAAVQDFVFS